MNFWGLARIMVGEAGKILN